MRLGSRDIFSRPTRIELDILPLPMSISFCRILADMQTKETTYMLLAEQAGDKRAVPDRRRSLRRENDLIEIKRKLAIGLTIVAAFSFLMGYLTGSGTLDNFRKSADTSAYTQGVK
jgi:hypothetical protein